jgi:Mrp family chromosome partitioning ATPase
MGPAMGEARAVSTLLLDRQAGLGGSLHQPGMRHARGEDVVVVIPTLNEEDDIEACLRSLMTGDIRLRQLTETSGVSSESGLLEYLFGEASLADVIKTDEKTGLHIMPLSDRKHTPRDVFGSRAFDALLLQLQQTYDLIVIDTGPLLLMAEARVVVSKVDQVVVATRWRKTQRNTLRDTMKILRYFHANVAGVVLTFVDLRKKGHHAYTSASHSAYAKYYQDA